MNNFTFADRYAAAGLAPSAELIVSRQEPAKRIVATIKDSQVLGLVGRYYGDFSYDLSWFRDEFVKEDPSFSLINNENETVLLAALVLAEKVKLKDAVTILAVVSGAVAGVRSPKACAWLLQIAQQQLLNLSVKNRESDDIETKVGSTYTTKLKEEVEGLGENDWAGLLKILGKIRSESQQSMSGMATQATKVLTALKKDNVTLREESDMLWWIFGGHSSSLARSFNTLTPHQAAVVSAIDLGNLTTSQLGPVSASAMLERVIGLAKRTKSATVPNIGQVFDSVSVEDLQKLEINHAKLPPRIAPLATALELARALGEGAWGNLFKSKTDLSATVELGPLALAEQLYFEHLLGQFL